MVICAFAEVVSLGSVVPFLGVLIEPGRIFANPTIASVAHSFGIVTAEGLTWPLTLIFILAALGSAALRLLVLVVNAKVSFGAGLDLSVDAYRKTLYQPYHIHVTRNSSEIISALVNGVGASIQTLYQYLLLASAFLQAIAIVLTLFAINFFAACIAFFGFGFAYTAISWLVRKRLRSNGKRIAAQNIQVYKALQEGLGGIRDVLLDETQQVYCDAYYRADYSVKRGQAENLFILGAPRFLLEALGIVLIALLAYRLSGQVGGVAASLPMLGALALGAQRLLPVLQQGYSAWSVVMGNHGLVLDILKLLDQPIQDESDGVLAEPLAFNGEIRFENVMYKYGSEGPAVVVDLNLAIPRGKRIGIVGSTGSGKSTTLDLLMGLLEPVDGQILVDGAPITGEHRRAWQRIITHVPQNIFLADATLAENIAFGTPLERIDMERVRYAAKQAQLASYIESLPKGYQTLVGERGVRLSGGQRQRIGIARALYKQAKVMILDEATSALDNATEQALMDAINNLGRDLTIILIAHRLNTVRYCDEIVQIEGGRVVAQGTYDQLISNNSNFQSIAKMNS